MVPIQALKSLPYISWTSVNDDEAAKRGVTRYDPHFPYKGINHLRGQGVRRMHIVVDVSGDALYTFRFEETRGSKGKIIEPYQNGCFLVLDSLNELFMKLLKNSYAFK